MGRTTTTISYRGSQEDKEQVEKLAVLLGLTVGDVVREAIDQVWGEKLAQVGEFQSGFFCSSQVASKQNKKRQSKNEGDE